VAPRVKPEDDKYFMKKYNHLILGGTFDHFHSGHELFIQTALNRGKRITVGITTEAMYQHKLLASQIESYKTRERNILLFIKKTQNNIGNISCIPLINIYGNGYTDKTVDGIVVTEDTKRGGGAINKKRVEIGMKPLDIIVVPMVKGDDGRIISSERIRYGDIDTTGKNYYKWLIDKAPFALPERLRSSLREPLGDLIQGGIMDQKLVVKQIKDTIKTSNPPMIFAIGDIITSSLLDHDCSPSISVIDFKTRREALSKIPNAKSQIPNLKRYRNPAGTIAKSVIKQVRVLKDRWMKDHNDSWLIIKGEEDMVALPVILLAPLNAFVLYGQYDLGVVLVKITEEKKRGVWRALKQFDY